MDLGMLWHGLAGAGLILFSGAPLWAQILVLLLGGWVREVLQHDVALSTHQLKEALAWPLGGLLAALVVYLSR